MTSALALPKVNALDAALDDLAADYLPSISRAEQADRALRLLQASQHLEGIMAIGLAEAERAGVALLGKQRTMAQYLASRSHCAPEVVRAHVRVGLWVSQFNVLEEAMLAGDLPRQHVDLLRRTDNIRVFAAMQRDQRMFIEWMKTLEWAAYKGAVKYWLMVNDQDGVSRFARTSVLACGQNAQLVRRQSVFGGSGAEGEKAVRERAPQGEGATKTARFAPLPNVGPKHSAISPNAEPGEAKPTPSRSSMW